MSDQQVQDPSNISADYLYQGSSIDQLRDLCKLLSILSRIDTLKLFLLAKNGFKAETDTARKTGLTRKQYYTRLKLLTNSGLIEKRDGSYLHTTMGNFVYEKQLISLLEAIKNAKQMRMIDVLKRARTFSEEEISNVVQDMYNIEA